MSTILPNDHRTSCHRCGNIRKNLHQCSECPQVFCSRCKEKMVLDHGFGVFDRGCPVVSSKIAVMLILKLVDNIEHLINKYISAKTYAAVDKIDRLPALDRSDGLYAHINESSIKTDYDDVYASSPTTTNLKTNQSQFHCYKKCPTTRLGGVNFGVGTPSPTDAVKYPQNRGRRTVQCSEQGPSTPAAYYSNNTQMPVAMAVTDDRLKNSDPHSNLFLGGKFSNAEECASGIPRDDHGSVDDIEHFFISADDWDRSQYTGTTRFYEEQNSAAEEDFIYGSTSSASMVIRNAYADSSIKDIYPFLSTPTPTSPAPQSPQVQTSPEPTERTSSLPLPSAQVNFYNNARQSDGIINNVRALGASDTKLQTVDCSHRLLDEMTSRAVSNHPGPYMGRGDANEREIQEHSDSTRVYGSQSLRHTVNVSNDRVSEDNITASVLKKGQKSKLSKPVQHLCQVQELKTCVKCKSKKARSGSADYLLSDLTTAPSRDSNLGPLESFLSSNYFIKDGLSDLTGPFFLQQSLHCYAKAPSLKELMSGVAATGTTTGVGTDASGLTANGKKRYRKHPASISATKIKNEALLAYQANSRDYRRDQNFQNSAPMHVIDADRKQPDEDMKLSNVRDGASNREDMWTVLRGNSYKENATARESSSMEDNVYKLRKRNKKDEDVSFTGCRTTENINYKTTREIAEFTDRSEDNFGPENLRGRRPQPEDSRQPSEQYSASSERTSTQGLDAHRSAALDNHLKRSYTSNRKDPQEQGALECGERHSIEGASRQTSYLDIYDPFQKFDDYYIMSPERGFREASVPIVNSVCILGNPWTYSYFNSEESQKGYAQTEPCRIKYESQETQGSSSSAIHAHSSTVTDPREVSIDNDVDAGVDELLISTLVEHIADDAEDSPTVVQMVSNMFTECDAPAASAVKLTTMLSPRAERQGGGYSTAVPSFPIPSNGIYQYRAKDDQEIRSLKKLESSSLNRSSSVSSTPSKSNPPLESVSFSPFMNFTPESDAKAIEHTGSGCGSGVSSGMAPYNILSVEPYNGEQSRGKKDQTVSVVASTAEVAVVALLRSSSGTGPESTLGWLDYTYDFAAE